MPSSPGTTVDYGCGSRAEYGHARYGVTYDKPLFEGWSADKKINLVGHSFGGATIRLFLDILADGSRRSRLRPRPTARRSPRFSRAARPTGSIR